MRYRKRPTNREEARLIGEYGWRSCKRNGATYEHHNLQNMQGRFRGGAHHIHTIQGGVRVDASPCQIAIVEIDRCRHPPPPVWTRVGKILLELVFQLAEKVCVGRLQLAQNCP